MRTFVLVLFGMLLLAGCLGNGACSDTADPVCGTDGKTYKNPCFAQKANATIDHKGACKSGPAGCLDSDGGKDIFTSGTVSSGGISSTDACDGKPSVKEYFCEGESISSAILPCPAGYECDTGRCRIMPCTDSDGGVKEGTKGTATSSNDSGTDECAQNGSLKEYYCDNNAVKYRYMGCPKGEQCLNGACVEIMCTDSDDGKDKFVKGTAYDGDKNVTDSCFDADTVTEAFCLSGAVKSENMPCGQGYDCLKGVCVEARCADSDSGKDQFTKGTVTYDDKILVDSCYSDTTVLEGFCKSDTEIANEKINCGSGHECVQGVCKRIECAPSTSRFSDDDEWFMIFEYDDGDRLTLYEDDIVEINSDMILKLHAVSGNQSTFRLYDDFQDYQDNDAICSFTLEEGESETDACGEDTGTIEIDTVDGADDMVQLYIDEYYAVQYTNSEGTETKYPDDSSCPDTSREYDELDIRFYPYLDTESSGLNLDGESIMLFGIEAELIEIDSDSIRFDLDGDDYNLEDGDVFEYEDKEFIIELTFTDGGLHRIFIEES